MKVAVMGYGTVGKGVYDMLCASPTLQAGQVLVRRGKASEAFMCDSIDAICADESIDAVAETIGGVDTAYAYARAAIDAGKHFVTSNKALVAARGVELAARARERGVGFLFSAACGGAVPFLHNLRLAGESDEIFSLGGILNGTTNYMLDRMQSAGLEYAAALQEAQSLGYAEQDPTADVSGLDALRKIMLGCAVAYDMMPTEGLLNEGIENISAADVKDMKLRGLTCRLLAKGGRNPDGGVYAYVQPVLVGADAPECAVKMNFNMAKYVGKNSGEIVFMGQGAGRYPTASAVIRDLECLRIGERAMLRPACREACADNSGAQCSYYVRIDSAWADKLPLASIVREGDVVRGVIESLSVQEMHALAASLRRGGARIFFAELA